MSEVVTNLLRNISSAAREFSTRLQTSEVLINLRITFNLRRLEIINEVCIDFHENWWNFGAPLNENNSRSIKKIEADKNFSPYRFSWAFLSSAKTRSTAEGEKWFSLRIFIEFDLQIIGNSSEGIGILMRNEDDFYWDLDSRLINVNDDSIFYSGYN